MPIMEQRGAVRTTTAKTLQSATHVARIPRAMIDSRPDRYGRRMGRSQQQQQGSPGRVRLPKFRAVSLNREEDDAGRQRRREKEAFANHVAAKRFR